MNNITSLSTYAEAHPRQLPTAAPQQPATITLQRALATTSAASLRAVADWNERESHNQRRRKARARLKSQAGELRAVAAQLERGGMREAA